MAEQGAASANNADDVPNDGTWADDAGTWQQVRQFKSDWRIEITGRGRYWIFRRGSHARRQSVYGGKFSELTDPVRKAEYVINRDIYHERRKAAEKRNTVDARSESDDTDAGVIYHA